jgi:hypothetical protein
LPPRYYRPCTLYLQTRRLHLVADMQSLLLLTLSATGTLALHGLDLFSRQELSCATENMKDCGTGCIPFSYTCCPDGSGGCPVTAVCVLADNDEYGCCPIGETCSGDGGVTTIPGGTFTSTVVEQSSFTSVAESFTSQEGGFTTESSPAMTTENTPSFTPQSTMSSPESSSGPSSSSGFSFTPLSGSSSTPSTAAPSSTGSSVPASGAGTNDHAGAVVLGGALAVAVALL